MKKSKVEQLRQTQLQLFENALGTMPEKFVAYHRDNPQIYDKFVEIAIKAIVVKKFKNLSAEFIFNIIRWETPITAVNDIYKINNNYKAFYSRLFMVQYPQHEGFFRTRESKADKMDMRGV
jgi:hypothetical protein